MRSMILMALILFCSGAYAHDGKHEASDQSPKTTGANAKDKKTAKLTGEVVDLTCYLSHNGQGTKHATCALDCIKKGNPVAILSNGVLYAIISSDHESPNTKVAPFAGKQVIASGEQSEKNGLHYIDLDTIEESPPAKR